MNMHYINAKITETKLGCLHDRGIMTFWIMLDFDGSGQGLGGYALDFYCKTTQKRLQTTLTGEVVYGVLIALELDSWEDLKGKYVRIAVDNPGLRQNILGIGHIVKDKFFMVDEVMEKYAG